MGINGVRRSGITRALAVTGYGMIGMVAVVVVAYAALVVAGILVAVALAVIVSHPFRSAPVVPVRPNLADDDLSRAHRALRTR